MPGLFDMPGLDMSTIVGILPRIAEARRNAQTMEGASMLAGGADLPPPPVMPPQGLDPSGSMPTPPPGPPTGLPPVQGFGQDALPPIQGLDPTGSGALPGAPSTPEVPAQGLDVPDNIAKVAAARGIPPPKMDMPSWAQTDPTVGAALTGLPVGGVPIPQPRPGGLDMSAQSRAPGAPTDITSDAQKAGEATPAAADGKRTDLATALRGVTAPKPPELQKISSPSPPRAGVAIKSGELQAILQALNAGPGPGGGLKLPSTLGQALGGR